MSGVPSELKISSNKLNLGFDTDEIMSIQNEASPDLYF
jgi:hypothetical protein